MQRQKPFDPFFWPLGPVDQYVGKRLRNLRNQCGHSVAHCAGVLGLSRDQFYQIEQGERHLQPGELIRISSFFYVEPMYFFDGFKSENEPAGNHATEPFHRTAIH